MIIKSHVRGGFTSAAAYLAEVGANEHVRPVEFNDHGARNLNEAFSNMWALARTTRATKPLHHVSINPHKDERLTDAQVLRICSHLERKYGYAPGEHQRVIVEHIKDGRQHFHVMWNRVSLRTGRPAWPGHHWKKSKQAAREIEIELGLKRPTPRRVARGRRSTPGRKSATPRIKSGVHRQTRGSRMSDSASAVAPLRSVFNVVAAGLLMRAPLPMRRAIRATFRELAPPHRPMPIHRHQRASLPLPSAFGPALNAEDRARRKVLAWAWANDRWDVLALYGVYAPLDL